MKSGVELTLAEHWNGSAWHIQPTPDPAGSPSSSLFAVACPAADTCTAVGTSNSKLLVERWVGARWHIESAPIPSGAQSSELVGISCAATSCIAVGDYVNGSGLDVTLAEEWNGTSWTIQTTPNVTGAQSFNALTGVSCVAPAACEASGVSDAGPFAEQWDGTSWSLQAVPAPAGAQFSQLVNVSCAVSSCEAVGGYLDGSGAFLTLGEQWNGTAWHAQLTPNPARASSNYLGGVSCPSPSDCTAVGQGNGSGTPITLAERWRDGRWNLQAVPSPVGAAENQLNGLACPATDRCVAVGVVGPTDGVLSTEALMWNGRTWHVQRIPTVPGAGLNTVSCASDTYCVAVGWSKAGTLVERWNGVRWTIQPTPNPRRAQGAGLNAISCASASNCMAVGSYFDSAGGQLVLAERWNGRSWRRVSAPTPSSHPQNAFFGVTCPASSACIAVGTSFDASGNPTGTFAERWNGTRWKVQRTPTRRTPGGFLASVWCKSVNACIATGSTNAGTLSERLSGTTWSVLRTPNQPGTQGDFMSSVSCTSLSACTGVGMAFAAPAGFPPQTLAERWNGVRWHIQPTPLLPGVGDLSNFSVACPARSSCIAAGGFENDGPGAKTLIERWRTSGRSAAQTAPAVFSSRAYRGLLGCVRASIRDGFANEAAAVPIAPWVKGRIPQQSQPASEIERIASLCSVA